MLSRYTVQVVQVRYGQLPPPSSKDVLSFSYGYCQHRSYSLPFSTSLRVPGCIRSWAMSRPTREMAVGSIVPPLSPPPSHSHHTSPDGCLRHLRPGKDLCCICGCCNKSLNKSGRARGTGRARGESQPTTCVPQCHPSQPTHSNAFLFLAPLVPVPLCHSSLYQVLDQESPASPAQGTLQFGESSTVHALDPQESQTPQAPLSSTPVLGNTQGSTVGASESALSASQKTTTSLTAGKGFFFWLGAFTECVPSFRVPDVTLGQPPCLVRRRALTRPYTIYRSSRTVSCL